MKKSLSDWKPRGTILKQSIISITFILTDCPVLAHLDVYCAFLQSHSCSFVIRLCEPETYPIDLLQENKIQVINLPFEDGNSLIDELIE